MPTSTLPQGRAFRGCRRFCVVPRQALSIGLGLIFAVVSGRAAPEITLQPQSQTVIAGQATTLSVEASGDDLTYAWRWNGGVIPGATEASIVLGAVSLADAGVYTVMVADATSASVLSEAARLRVAASEAPTLVSVPSEPVVTLERSATAVNAILPLADGRVYIGGDFEMSNGVRTGALVRLKADHTRDESFAASFLSVLSVTGLVQQTDGKIVVAGSFVGSGAANESDRFNFMRLNADGSVDPTFRTNGFDSNVTSLVALSDGRLLVAGYFSHYVAEDGQTVARSGMAVLQADGSLDGSVVPEGLMSNVQVAAQLPDGRFLVGGSGERILVRLEADGSFDESLGDRLTGFVVNRLLPLADGAVIIAGSLNAYDATPVRGLLRLKADGSREASFGADADSRFLGCTLVKPATGGGYWVASRYRTYGSGDALLRLDESGATVDTFAIDPESGLVRVTALLERDDGTLLLGGETFDAQHLDLALAQVSTGALAGVSSLKFGYPGQVMTAEAAGLNEWWIAGWFDRVNGQASDGVVRVNAGGEIVASYDLGWDQAYSVRTLLHEADGGLLVGGNFYADAFVPVSSIPGAGDHLVRIGADGVLDPEFPTAKSSARHAGGMSGAVESLARSPDGAVLMVGAFETVQGVARYGVARLTTAGELDANFDPGETGVGSGNLHQALVDSQGKVYVRGAFSQFAGRALRGVVRLSSNASVAESWSGVETSTEVTALLLDSEGRLIVGRRSLYPADSDYPTVLRLGTDDSRDAEFIVPVLDGGIRTIVEQADGRLLVAGDFDVSSPSTPVRSNLVRLATDGALDESFVAAGFEDAVGTLLPLDDGRLFVARDSQVSNSIRNLFAGIIEVGAAPTISTVPIGQTVNGGQSITLSVVASGTEPLTYQWRRNGALIPGSTASTLAVDDIDAGDIGDYSVEVSNAFGTAISAVATLSNGDVAPTITTQPIEQRAVAGQAITLRVNASGASGLVYQWYRDGFVVPGANSATLSLANASLGDAGHYTVRVLNGLSSITSARVRVIVTPSGAPGYVTVNEPMSRLVFESDFHSVGAMAKASNGAYYLAGSFATVDGEPTAPLVRIDANGVVDPNFTAPNFVSGSVECFLVQADGKVLIGGFFELASGQIHLARLNANGSIDDTFLPKGMNNSVTAIKRLTDGRLVLAGHFDRYIYPDGQQVAVDDLVVLSGDGALDENFSYSYTMGLAHHIQPTRGGGLVIAGDLNVGDGMLAKLDSNGILDTSFATLGGFSSDAVGSVTDVLEDSTGRLYVLGSFGGSRYQGTVVGDLLRLDADGKLDTSFHFTVDRADFGPSRLMLDDDGTLWVAYSGYYYTPGSPLVVRVSESGAADSGFSLTGAPNGHFRSVTQLLRVSESVLLVGGRGLLDGLRGLMDPPWPRAVCKPRRRCLARAPD